LAEINRRERKKIFSQKAIVESAVKLFTQKGYQETTVADIMSEADLGIGTFYNYFQSKEDILKHLLFQIIVETNDKFEELQKESRLAGETLREMFLFTAEILDSKRFVLPLFLSAAHKGGLKEQGMEQLKDISATDKADSMPKKMTFKHIFDQIIKAGQASGEFRQDIPAEIITEMFHSVFQAASFSSIQISFLANIRYKLTLIMDGIILNKE